MPGWMIAMMKMNGTVAEPEMEIDVDEGEGEYQTAEVHSWRPVLIFRFRPLCGPRPCTPQTRVARANLLAHRDSKSY